MELEKFFLISLRRPADHPDLTEAEIGELQLRHLSYLAGLRQRGVVAFNGPVRGGADEALRGLAFYRTETAAEALDLAAGDPMVQANWLRADVVEFWTQPGAITLPGVRFTL